ncbi:MAG: putative phosphoribosyl transferase [Paracoccaceae bacterium]|jgi:putative phosphoribosyl transferase
MTAHICGQTGLCQLREIILPRAPVPHALSMDNRQPTFTDRAAAAMALDRPAVHARPRGGVPVALAGPRALKAPLDLVMVRKTGAPLNANVALGAIVEGTAPLNEDVRQATAADDAYIERDRAHVLAETDRRCARYFRTRAWIDPAGRTAILVNDGLATGATMKATLGAIRRQGALRITVAVPAGPADTLADNVICLIASRTFRGVGWFLTIFIS